jgi:hypothetical protein
MNYLIQAVSTVTILSYLKPSILWLYGPPKASILLQCVLYHLVNSLNIPS